MTRRSRSQMAAQRNMKIMLAILSILIVGAMVLQLAGAISGPVITPPTPTVRAVAPLPLATP